MCTLTPLRFGTELVKSSHLLPESEINATGFNYQNEDEKVTLSFPSTLQKGERQLRSSVAAKP